jgi:membrane-bound lytic murein transglycosylase D
MSLFTGCQKDTPNTLAAKPWSVWGWLPHPHQDNLWAEMRRHINVGNTANHKAVQKEIKWFAKNQNYLNLLAHNANPYLYYVYQQTQKRHMPAIIALLPMIESNYNPFVHSHVGAVGLWQMMPGTASGLGLKINWWYDGRRNIITATNAALNYLAYLHDFFGNWLLAIAAYDSGEGTIQDAVRHNRRLHKPTDYWSLDLPYETKLYIPKLIALATIIENPHKYHIDLPFIANNPAFTKVEMQGQISFERIAKLSDTSAKKIRKLNPGFRRWATMPKEKYDLLVPADKAKLFKASLKDARLRHIKWQHHTVRSGDSLSKIAHEYHTRVSVLREVNNIKGNLLHINQRLLVPYNYHGHFKHAINAQHGLIAEENLPGPVQIIHKVHPRESIWSIAKRYGVKAREIRFWNNLSHNDRLQVNQEITIWEPRRHYYGHLFQHYCVRKGDSLTHIAKLFGVKVATIKRDNHLNNNMIRIGQKLKILRPYHNHHHYHAKIANQMVIHHVRAGESVNSIAHYYRVPAESLMSWNHLEHNSLLHIGQELHIYLTR